MKLFDILNHINKKTDVEKAEVVADFNSFIINRAFSMGADTVYYANEMNQMSSLDKGMVYDFYYSALPKANRFNKWQKREDFDSEMLESIIHKYNVSHQTACTYLSMMSDDEKEQLKIARGGVSGKSN